MKIQRRASLMALLWVALCAGALSWAGCGKAKPAISYAGKTLPALVEAEQVRTFAGGTPPDGHDVIGVITSRCETINDSSGVLAGRCSHPSMRKAAKAHAAMVGGTGLLDLACSTREMEREHTRQDAGQSRVDIRHMVLCRATVVRGPVDMAAVAAEASAAASAAQPGARTIELAGITVEVSITPVTGMEIERRARTPDEVGELNEAPNNAIQIARLKARCTSGCARNVPHRALRQLAAEIGALAIAETSCSLTGDRWQCSAIALDQAPARQTAAALPDEVVAPAPEPPQDAGGVE